MAKQVLVCGGTGCLSAGADDIEKRMRKLLETSHCEETSIERVVKTTGCIGPCSVGPTILIMPDETLYTRLTVDDVEVIVNEHLKGDKPVEALMQKSQGCPIRCLDDWEFFSGQTRIALRNTGFIDPLALDDYLERDGYQALRYVLEELTPDQVIEEIKKSELRGRGGAGFPAGLKWEFARKADSPTKYIVCNADEGDPGAFMDRSILEGDPHSIIEAMIIAGYAVGASQGYVYVRAEYPLAVKNLQQALETANSAGYLGDDLFNQGFSFQLTIRIGAGAFVCGEETALLASIEGKRGLPRSKPPFPATDGLWGQPTVINNVETLANVPAIILNGSSWFTSIGTATSKGTKVFAVAGDVNYTGLLEVPMGTSLRRIVYDIAGGIPEGKELKAIQIGGPSGGTIPADYIDLEIDFESLQEVGAIVGSGGLIIMDEDTCMVDVARFFLDFTQDESCGKCTPCRVGARRMLEILTRITEGNGALKDLEQLESLASLLQTTSLCGLGQTAPNPVLSTLRFFRSEYMAHITDKVCPAGRCKNLVRPYAIDADICIGCTQCITACPVDAIDGERKSPHSIDPTLCISCGECVNECPVDAISRLGERR